MHEIKKKGRPKKARKVKSQPRITQFSPRGKPGRPDEIQLTVDQYEAIRLADYQRHDQSSGAQAMGVSRATFGRILREARKLVAEALTKGKIIKIFGGDIAQEEKDNKNSSRKVVNNK